MIKMKKENLEDVIESFIYQKLDKNEYSIDQFKATDLLTWNRFDLAFKLFYLDNKEKNSQLAMKVYKEDIRSQTLGNFKEHGREDKDSFSRYIEEFDKTYNSIKKDGFNSKSTLIPLSEENTIVNGAHRVASAIHLNKEVSCTKLDLPIMTCDYNYFYERNVPKDILDIAVSKFIEYANNTYIAFLWPSGKGYKKEAESKFSKVVYKKEISLTSNGGFNLLFELYKHMDWVGNDVNGYQGIKKKLVECFPRFEKFTVIVFQSESLERVREIKEQVRQIYDIGFSSIHITDTKEEAIRISRLLFNENGLHFLNNSAPKKYKSTYEKLLLIKNFIEKNKLNPNEILFDSGIVLSLYGLRECSDVDYFVEDNSKIKYTADGFEHHDGELKYHAVDKLDLIFDPTYHFYFDGLKFTSFNQIHRMKNTRGGTKDKNDCKIMESVMENNHFKRKINQLKQSIFYFRIKCKNKLINAILLILKITKLYQPIRAAYKKIKR